MSAPVRERPHFDYPRDRRDHTVRTGPGKASAREAPDAPPLLLPGSDDDGTEPHICRGID